MPTEAELTEQMNDATRRMYAAEAEIKALWAERGAAIAKKFGYGILEGLDAVHRYIIDKYHWLPSQVRALTHDELELVLAGEDLPGGTRSPERTGGARKNGRTPAR